QSCPSPRLGHPTKIHTVVDSHWIRGNMRVAFLRGRSWGAMKAFQAACIVGAMAFTGMIHQVGGNTPGASVRDATPEAAASAERAGAPALSAAVPEASPGPGTELGSVPAAVSGPSLMAKAEIGDASIETKSADLGHHDAAQTGPTTPGAADDA